ncbi:hypothetical protein ACQXY3_11030 [Corynebacterium diphtheriae]|uniref:hypothetical protein n=1 Tax=Corynebacterium diphtheriae TaxID=1717 RepID=UPI00403DA8AF
MTTFTPKQRTALRIARANLQQLQTAKLPANIQRDLKNTITLLERIANHPDIPPTLTPSGEHEELRDMDLTFHLNLRQHIGTIQTLNKHRLSDGVNTALQEVWNKLSDDIAQIGGYRQ